MIRKHIIKEKINTSEIHHVIGHHGSVFFKLLFNYTVVLIILLLIFLILNRYVGWSYLNRVFAGVGFIIFIKFCLDFCDLYLDCLAFTDFGIVLYLREGLLEYKTDNFARESIEAISFNQKGIWDKIFVRGDINIRLEHGIDFSFDNVHNPQKEVDKILKLKSRFLAPVQKAEAEKSEEDNKKFDLLVEALGEVIQDYMDKSGSDNHKDENGFL